MGAGRGQFSLCGLQPTPLAAPLSRPNARLASPGFQAYAESLARGFDFRQEG